MGWLKKKKMPAREIIKVQEYEENWDKSAWRVKEEEI